MHAQFQYLVIRMKTRVPWCYALFREISAKHLCARDRHDCVASILQENRMCMGGSYRTVVSLCLVAILYW